MTRVTVIGAGTSAPQPETPASGILVETPSTAILVDCGQGVIRGLMPLRDPRELDAIIVGHLHADHYIDLVSLRYLMPWAGFTGRRVPVLLPPGGRRKMDELASAISEREGFFDHTFEVVEFDASKRLEIGDLTIDFLPGLHYVPAWGCAIRDRSDRLVVVTGDTGPNDALVEASRGADVFIVEATLLSPNEDDPARGHLTYDEALDMGAQAGAGQTVLVHHRPQNREAILAACAARANAVVGLPGLAIDLAAARSGRPPSAATPPANGLDGSSQANGVGADGAGADGDAPVDADLPAGTASRAARAR
ncbi:MAG TPA: MBL fold metallo-hydrolase [Candidatus Limnocylindrales bacterium]|nr:MBL fold metallo-hydrolase [Candidatus Limnocylindrales bacterium]